MKFEQLRKRTLQGNHELVKQNLVIFTWGNLSIFDRDLGVIAIKPSGVKYETMKPEDIVILDIDGNVLDGELNPSSDTETHLEIYRNFEDVNSIVHTHSKYATSFAQANLPIECYGTTQADYFYNQVPVARELSKEEIKDYEKNTGKVIIETFEKESISPKEVPSCLVCQHGPFSWGENEEKAIYHAKVLEEIAEMNYITLTLNKDAPKLSSHILEKHYQRKHGKDAYYGQK